MNKICTKCNLEKDVSEFYKDSDDKLRASCKKCCKTYKSEEDRQKALKRMREYSKNMSKEKKKTYNEKYYNLEYHRAYQDKNKEKIKAYRKQYQKKKDD